MIALLLLAIAARCAFARASANGVYFLFIIFLLLTSGFQLVPSGVLVSYGPLEKASDYALLLIFIVGLRSVYVGGWAMIDSRLRHSYAAFLIFLLSSLAVTAASNSNTFINTIQVLRGYLMVLAVLSMVLIPKKQLQTASVAILVMTVFAATFYSMQPMFNESLITDSLGRPAADPKSEGWLPRYYNTPALLGPALILLISRWSDWPSWPYKLSALAILSLALVLSQHRGTAVAVVVACLAVKASSGSAIVSIGKGILVATAVVAIGMLIDPVRERVTLGISDLQFTLSGLETGIDGAVAASNTSAFRLAHFLERYEYICQSIRGFVWGVGLMSDNSPLAYRLPFEFGNFNISTGEVSRIDTGDIAWSVLILNLGIVGLLVLLYVISSAARVGVELRESPWGLALARTVIFQALNSFSSSEFLLPYSLAWIGLLIAIALGEKREARLSGGV